MVISLALARGRCDVAERCVRAAGASVICAHASNFRSKACSSWCRVRSPRSNSSYLKGGADDKLRMEQECKRCTSKIWTVSCFAPVVVVNLAQCWFHRPGTNNQLPCTSPSSVQQIYNNSSKTTTKRHTHIHTQTFQGLIRFQWVTTSKMKGKESSQCK